MKKIPLLLFVLLFAACSSDNLPTAPIVTDVQQPPTAAVQLQAERTSATTVLLTLRNGSTNPIGYNLCHTAMERLEGGNWQNVPDDGVCTMELRTLAPGSSATFTRQLRANLQAGQYRFVTRAESPLGGRMDPVVSNTITL